MKIGISIVPIDIFEDFQIVKEVLKLGIDLITFSDYHKAEAPFPIIRTVNEEFSNLRIGTSVTNIITRDLNFIAHFFLEEANKKRNKLLLGIGAGDWTILRSRSMAAKDSIELLRKGLGYFKEFFNKEKTKVDVFVGAQGLQTLKMIKQSDGLIINLAHPKDIIKALELIEERKNKEIFVIAQTFIGLDSLEYARKSAAIIYAGLSNSSIKIYGFDEKKRNLLRTLIQGNKIDEARNILSAEDIKRLTICGNIDEVRRRIETIMNLDIDGLIIGLPMGKERYITLENLYRIL